MRRTGRLRRRTALQTRTSAIRRSAAIPGRSAKQGRSDAILAASRDERRRLANGWCEGNTPACVMVKHPGSHAHHVAGRASHDVDNLRWLCPIAHQWVHAHPAWSYEHGLMVKRNG